MPHYAFSKSPALLPSNCSHLCGEQVIPSAVNVICIVNVDNGNKYIRRNWYINYFGIVMGSASHFFLPTFCVNLALYRPIPFTLTLYTLNLQKECITRRCVVYKSQLVCKQSMRKAVE